MARLTPLVSNGSLTYWFEEQQQHIPVDSPVWWNWLRADTTTTFRFEACQGNFTARREWKSNGYYWYAYRKLRGRLRKAYLGKTEDLSLARLETIARQLATAESSIPLSRTAAFETVAPGDEMQLRITALDHASHPLLTTKLFPPPTRPQIVERSHLIERLVAGVHRKLTILSAPAGFGKTMLLSAWCHTPGNALAFSWLSLDAGDNDPARFWTYVIAAFQEHLPVVETQVLPLLSLLPPPPIESLLTTLINALATSQRTLVLILDDYHLITEQAIHDSLAFLLNNIPSQIHLVIASRSDPPLPLTLWRARGQLNELRVADLRFTSGEVTTFFSVAIGLDLSRKEIASLDVHTEGWIAGLQLAALSMQGRKDIPAFIASFTGGHRFILDYLSSEVLNRQSEEVRTFLLQTSILERLNASLCDAVTGRSDSQAMLEWLEQANLFLIPLDERRQWYRYHHLFAEFLHDRLRQTYPDLLPTLHLRASRWYEGYGLVSATVDHALASADTERVIQLIERFGRTMMMRGEVGTFLNWLRIVPIEVIRAHPHLHLYLAGVLVSVGQLDAADACLQEIAPQLERWKSGSEEVALQIDLRLFESEFYTARAVLASFRGELQAAIEFAHKALAFLPENDTFMRSIIAISSGNAYLFSGDIVKANEAFLEAITVGELAQNQHVVLASKTCQGILQVASGHLRQAAETYQQTLRSATRQGGRMFSIASLTYASLGTLLYEWNDLDAAEQAIQKAIEIGARWGFVGVLAQSYGLLADIRLAHNHVDEALALIRQAEQLAHDYTLPFAIHAVAARHARIQLLTGELEAATRWALTCDLRLDETLSYLGETEYLTLVEVYIAQGQFVRANEFVERMLLIARSTGRIYIEIACLSLQAISQYQRGLLDKGIATLTRALRLAEPENFIRTFVDRGEPMVALLRQTAAHGVLLPYVHKLLIASGDSVALSPPPHKGILSERELYLLQLIASGMSNHAIANELVIAISTVKTHLNNIYVRLGVHSRTQAIARAKELHLLS